MTALVINLVTLALLALSFFRDKSKTKKALKIAFQRGKATAPTIFLIIAIIGLLLGLFPPALIEKHLGGDSHPLQILLAAGIGSIVMIPSLIAFPLAGSLMDSGAGSTPIAAFITTLTMVGIVSIPLEVKEMGKRLSLLRNVFAFIFAIIIALLMGVLLA